MNRISTGAASLDAVLHGGLPEHSTTLLAGLPGTGKTVLTLKMLFANAACGLTSLYFTTISEPAAKVLRYQQEFDFFDDQAFNSMVRFVDLGTEIKRGSVQAAMDVIRQRIEEFRPNLLAIDSFKVISDMVEDDFEFRGFVHELSVELAVWGCTAILVGEYTLDDLNARPESAVADNVLHLELYGPDALAWRVLRVHKMRGSSFHEGEHAYAITGAGVVVYPRLQLPPQVDELEEEALVKVSSGVPALDAMLGGGLNEGLSTMVAGSAGTGKTTFALHFIHEGLQQGEKALWVSMEESPAVIVRSAAGYGLRLKQYVESGQLTFLHRRPVDLNVYCLAQEIRELVEQQGIRRATFDAISDLQSCIRQQSALRDFLFSLAGLFEAHKVTSVLTNIIENAFGEFRITQGNLSVVVDAIILLRYVELESRTAKAISVLKTRGSNQDKTLRRYEITPQGVEILGPFEGYGNIISGAPLPITVQAERGLLEELVGDTSV
ncbi:MAG: ATPase domain-containing protein [Armatimonadota bacterium]